jgi:hypothetical protein
MKYEKLVFLQGEEANTALNILDKYTPKAALIHLTNLYMGLIDPIVSEDKPWGDADNTYEVEDLVLSWNDKIGYIGVTKFTENVKTSTH